MEPFSRYTDNKNNLFVVLERRGTPVPVGNGYELQDRRVLILNVHTEQSHIVPADYFERKVSSGELTRIPLHGKKD